MGEFDQKGTVPTKYGTRKEYGDAIEAVHGAGMRVMVDIVMNHKAGGDEAEKIKVVRVDEEDRNKVLSEPFEIEAFTKFTFPGRQKKYSEFIWNYLCLIHGGCAVVISNGDSGVKRMEMGKRYAGKKFIDMMEKNPAAIEINQEGWVEFFIPAGSVSVWVEK